MVYHWTYSSGFGELSQYLARISEPQPRKGRSYRLALSDAMNVRDRLLDRFSTMRPPYVRELLHLSPRGPGHYSWALYAIPVLVRVREREPQVPVVMHNPSLLGCVEVKQDLAL